MDLPGGDPAGLLEFATHLAAVAKSAAELGSKTGTVMGSIRSRAAWTGQAATASAAMSGDLSDGVSATAAPLTRISAAMRDYATALSDAQQKVGAYNLYVAAAAQTGSKIPEHMTAMQDAGKAAQSAVGEWEAAAQRTAGVIHDATSELQSAFRVGGPVRTYLTSVPADDPYSVQLAGAGVLRTPPAENLGSQTMTDAPVLGPDPGTGDVLPEVAGGTLVNVPAGELGLPTISTAQSADGEPGAEGNGSGQDDTGQSETGQQGGFWDDYWEQFGKGEPPGASEPAGTREPVTPLTFSNETIAESARLNGEDRAAEGGAPSPTMDEIYDVLQTGQTVHIGEYAVVTGQTDDGRQVDVHILVSDPVGSFALYR